MAIILIYTIEIWKTQWYKFLMYIADIQSAIKLSMHRGVIMCIAMKNIRKTKRWVIEFAAPAIIILFFSLLSAWLVWRMYAPEMPGLFPDMDGGGADSPPVQLHAAIEIFLSYALVVVAWVQLSGLQRLEKSKFLLQIVDQYGSEQLIKARSIIHEIYLDSEAKCIKQTKGAEDSIDQKLIRDEMGQRIVALSMINNEPDRTKYTYLLSMMDFLETLSYMANEEEIKSEVLSDTLGNSLEFYYEIFYENILKRRSKYNKATYYVEFEKLYNRLVCYDT